jgi:stage II sporulation protein D
VINRKIKYYILIFFIFITLVLFCINIIKEKREELEKQEEEYEQKEEKNIIEYKANEQISVRLSKTNEVVAMDINDYLRGVLPAEMSPKYNLEALKAQAVVARTYTYKKINDGVEENNADICDDYNHCQAFYTKDKIYEIWENKGYTKEEILEFWDKINEAVVSTQGIVITYNGELINAFFHASSPNRTENVDQIWNGVSYPYLVSVENLEDEDYENRTSKLIISFSEFKAKVESDNSIDKKLTADTLEDISIVEYTTSGRVKSVKVNDIVISAEKLRTLIGLKSTDFKIEVDNQNIIFNVIGYGHGVGMSQVGANTYANLGLSYEEIIKHYYTGVDINKLI